MWIKVVVYEGTYQLIAGYAEDIQPVEVEATDHTVFYTETLLPGQLPGRGIKDVPFAPDLGEMLLISINCPVENRISVEIFDLEGRSIRTLTENAAGGKNDIFWYGENDNREQVSIGIYLLFLEVRTPKGDTTTETKPIVVGTPLR